MKKKCCLAVLAGVLSMILISSCGINPRLPPRRLGARYDDDSAYTGVFTWTGEYLQKFETACEEAKATEWVCHEESAVQIAEAVAQERFPDHRFLNLQRHGVVYYTDLECWGVVLWDEDDRSIVVFISKNTGSVLAVTPP